ncbi:retrotransposon protein, putative, ty1-copia subclass [Tanacetum coccineum]
MDALALTPCYSAFLITTDVPEVYMHQFWDSIHKYENSYRFRTDKKKKFDLNLEIFRYIILIYPRVHGQNFDALLTDEDIVSFYKELGHIGEIKTITDIVVDQMHQPRRTFATIINRSLSGKTTGLDKLRLSRAQILWGMYYKKNVDYVELLWEDFTYQIDNRGHKKQDKMYYPRFTKVIIHHFLTKDKTISKRNKIGMHTSRDDYLINTLRFVSTKEESQIYGARLPKSMTSPEMRETKAYKTYLGYATGVTPPKKARKFKKPASPKLSTVPASPEEPTRKSKRVKRPAKKSSDAPTAGVVIRETPVKSLSKKKEKMTVEKRKGIDLLSEVALTKLEASFQFHCVSCMSGKMARKPYSHQVERAKDLLGLIHTYVCGPFKIMSRQGASYFVTFTYDFSLYGYVYLLKHKHEVFETFKVFQKEVENQLGKTIKSLRSNCGGEYMSQEFLDHLKEHGTISHRTPPYTPQHNGVSERRNRTLLDMVRSMMSQTTLPKSFWDYALGSTARILNMVPTKKVDKTPYEVWYGQVPKLSYLKVWGCEALVKHDTLTKPDKLEPGSIKCIFVGYPKEIIGYSFYNPPKNKVFVARNAEFLENSLIAQEASGSLEHLEIIQEEDTHPSIDTSLNHEEDDQEIDEPQSDINPILGDLGEPANYKSALLDPKSDKWLNAMNVEMQSMRDNEVWELVDLPFSGKTIGHKWLFKKKTDMDGAIHTYKAHISAIRILITIAVFYDYEIWKMDVKAAFLNGYLNEEVASGSYVTFLILYVDDILIMGNNIPMLQYVKSYLGICFAMKDLGEASYIPGIKIYQDRSKKLFGLCQSAYIEKILKRFYMENSKRGTIPMQEKLKLSKSEGASTPAEIQRLQNIPYALAVGSIMYVVRCTRLDVAFAQNITSRFQHNPDAEYIAAFDASKEAVWIRKFIFGLGGVPTIEEPINMYCDNTGAIAIAKDHEVTKCARHFHAKVHYL